MLNYGRADVMPNPTAHQLLSHIPTVHSSLLAPSPLTTEQSSAVSCNSRRAQSQSCADTLYTRAVSSNADSDCKQAANVGAGQNLAEPDADTGQPPSSFLACA